MSIPTKASMLIIVVAVSFVLLVPSARGYAIVALDAFDYSGTSPSIALWTGCGPGYPENGWSHCTLPWVPPYQQCDRNFPYYCHVIPVSNGFINSENLACTYVPPVGGDPSNTGCGMDAAMFSISSYNWQTGTRMIDSVSERVNPGARWTNLAWCGAEGGAHSGISADNNQMIHYLTLYDNSTGSYVRLVVHTQCLSSSWFLYFTVSYVDQTGAILSFVPWVDGWLTNPNPWIRTNDWLDLTIQLSHDGQALLKVYDENTLNTYTKLVSTILGTVNHPIKAGIDYRHNEKSSVDWITFTSAYQPSQPTLSGPTSGQSGSYYSFSAVSTNAETSTVQYDFDWGDGLRDLSGPVAPNTPLSLTHEWPAGTYQVSVLTVDAHGTYSDWSTGITVTITASGGGGTGCKINCPNGPTP